jgi:hypothetical protein
MRTASCYTNKVKITAYAKNTKVDYPGHVAKNWELLQAALPCNPNFTVQNYIPPPICSGPAACTQAPPVYIIPLLYTVQDPNLSPDDPGSGYLTYAYTDPNYSFRISNLNSNGDDASQRLSAIAVSSIITLTKTSDPSASFQIQVVSKTNLTTYWDFECTLLSSIPGSIGIGTNLTLTYI